MTAALLTASFNFRGIFLTYWLKSRATVLIFTSPLVTLRLKEFQQIRVAMNYQISLFTCQKFFMCNYPWERRQNWRGSAHCWFETSKVTRRMRRRCGDKIREGAVKGRKRQLGKKRNTWQLQPFTPLCQREALHLCNICPPKQLPPWAVSLETVPLFTPRRYPQSDRHAQS